MGEFIGLISVILIFGAIPAIVIFIASRRHKERMEMLKKGVDPALFTQTPAIKTGSAPLLWGLIAVAIGLAMLISAIGVQRNFDRDMFTFALFFVFGGCATLLYWKLTAKERERARRMHEEHLEKAIAEYSSKKNAGQVPDITDNVQ